MSEHDQRGEYLGERGSSVESESVPSRPTFAVPLLAEEGQAAASPPPTEQAAAVVPLQAGMTNPELALAWVSKVPGVKPTDEELRAFALGAEVGFARALSAADPVVVQPSSPEQMALERDAAYMRAKLSMVMPLFQEARDALCAITEVQRVAHRISPTLADRMDEAGYYSPDDWTAAQQAGKEQP